MDPLTHTVGPEYPLPPHCPHFATVSPVPPPGTGVVVLVGGGVVIGGCVVTGGVVPNVGGMYAVDQLGVYSVVIVRPLPWSMVSIVRAVTEEHRW